MSFAIDLRGQLQQVVYFLTEDYDQNPAGAVTFSDTSFSFARPPDRGCALHRDETPDARDTYSTPVVSSDGLTCSIANITIYSPEPPVPAR